MTAERYVDITLPKEPWRKTRTVPAIETITSGLVVTQAVFYGPGFEGLWTVTHEETGDNLRLYFTTSDQAAAFAGDMAPLADWTTDVQVGQEFRQPYLAAKYRHGGLFAWELRPSETTPEVQR